MKIHSLEIRNFRGIDVVELENLKGMVVIAGPNGSGKSCLLDAIRLLKSVYGGYQQNEWQQWLGEFQINFTQDPSAFWSIMQDKTKPLVIRGDFTLHSDEKQYLQDHAHELVRQSVWRVLAPESYGWKTQAASLAEQYRAKEPEAQLLIDAQMKDLSTELSQPTVRGELTIDPGGEPKISPSKVLELVFSLYRPHDIGVIEYHGAQRSYSRENVQGINLNLETTEQQRSQHALYNYAGKYVNVKSEMAAAFVREALASKAGVDVSGDRTLEDTLKELFKRFFPDKEFLGPQATTAGTLRFPVKTSSGAIHDLDELSSGEKEVLYGYLRLRHSAPKNSVVLLDEPELHLNPRLLRGFSDFYHRHIGKALNNQLWLITHSDALLRESVGRDGYSVFHMQPTSARAQGVNQALELSVEADVERAVMDLVGDLAAYRPGAKIVIFEGGDESEFDQRMTGTLFPTFISEVNGIPGNNKARVQHLHDVLDKAVKLGNIPIKVFSIVDWDMDGSVEPTPPAFRWNVYHIENYLLEPQFIRSVLCDIRIPSKVPAEVEIYEQLRSTAKKTLPNLIRHRMSLYANKLLVECINTRSDPNAASVAQPLFNVITSSFNRVQALTINDLSLDKLKAMEADIQEGLNKDISSDRWRSEFRGRDILKRFVDDYASEVKYEVLRDLIIARMRDAGYEPIGMRRIVDGILND